MSKLSKTKNEEIAKKIEELGQQGAANFYKVSRSTLRDHAYKHGLPTRKSPKKIKAEKDENLQLENEKLTQRIKELEKVEKVQYSEHVFGERVVDAIEKAALTRDVKYEPAQYKTNHGKTPHEFALQWSDAHAGEVVDLEEMNGINKYDYDILLKRHDKIRKSLFSYQDNRTFPVETLHLWMLGDNVTGNIHPELIETNEFPQAEAAVQYALDAAEFVESLKEGFKKIVINGVVGNHGRFTIKKKAKTAYDSLDWMIYQTMAVALRKTPNVEINVGKSSMQVVEIANRNVLLWHGDGVRSSMVGVPWGGLIRRATNLQSQFAAIGQPIYLYSVGHFHQNNLVRCPAGLIAMNGSIIGPTEHSMREYGHGAEASQSLLTFHPKKGLTDYSAIDLSNIM
jgi:hypothetical protein